MGVHLPRPRACVAWGRSLNYWKTLGTGQPHGNLCPLSPSPLLWNKQGVLEPFRLDRPVSEGPSGIEINAWSQALSSRRTFHPRVR